jgi:hypothetical protein
MIDEGLFIAWQQLEDGCTLSIAISRCSHHFGFIGKELVSAHNIMVR